VKHVEEHSYDSSSPPSWEHMKLSAICVSAKSMWLDNVWYFDNPTHGQGASTSTIRWSCELSDKTNLTDPCNVDILTWAKILIFSLFVDPRNGMRAFSYGSARLLFLGVITLIDWMLSQSLRRISQLSKSVLDQYVQDLPEILSRKGKTEGVGIGTAWPCIRIPIVLWKQRSIFEKMNIQPIPIKPWSEISGKRIARLVADKAEGWIPPLPDEVSIPVLNKAWWFLSGPHLDLLSINEQKNDAKLSKGVEYRSGVLKLLRDFQFRTLGGDSEPWHVWDEKSPYWKQFARLYRALMSACLIVLQATTGMRASEICGLRASESALDELPSNVRKELSLNGKYELFILTSELSKWQSVPRLVEWLLGVRVVGETNNPPGVEAMMVLNKIHAGFKSFNDSDFLLHAWFANTIPRSINGLGRFTGKTLRLSLKSFLERWVSLESLPDQSKDWVVENDLVVWKESKGRIIKSHQFRKTFAQFVLAVEPKLLPAVQMQFHHLSMTMTETYYWGRFRVQLESIDSVQQQKTALLLYEMATGEGLAAGRQGRNVKAHIEVLRRRVEGFTKFDGWHSVMSYMLENHIRIWFAPHGSCMPLDDSEMKCHQVCGTRPIAGNAPNYRAQQPDICMGCSCFIVDSRHLMFWKNRLESCRDSLSSPHAADLPSFRVIKERSRQAEKIVNLLMCGEREL